ncbi:MAG: hypothetical protein FJ303_21975 [Planctomycetes bacterium]|nr:hypothetical protein [Planctomycetota bacterium]
MDPIPELRLLLSTDRLMALGPGKPDVAAMPLLQQLEATLLGRARDRNAALACLAGLWLLHDFLDESHSISQDLATTEGSYWHGIMHRREPDYWNAKYWFRRVPTHPIHGELQQASLSLAIEAGCDVIPVNARWDAPAFVDLCERAVSGGAALELLCRRIQQREWELLFHYCHARAF